MKVLQINATYGYGSTGLIMRDIGDTLVASGNEAYFAYQSANGDVPNGYAVGSFADCKAHALLCRVFGRQGYYSHIPTKKLLRYIDKIKPDVVHLHNLHSNYVHLNKLLDYLGRKDIPTLITLHDCWLFTGKCFHYIDVGCDGFTKECGRCPKRMAAPASLIFDCSRQVIRDRNKYLHLIPRLKIIGCSQWIVGEARRGLMKDLDISSIRNGVDTSIFKPQSKEKAKRELGLDNKFVILGMANKWLLPENAEFFEKIKASLTDSDRILLVGCTEAQLHALRDEEKIVAVGFIKGRQSMAMHYAASDVFLNVTHADTLPTVNMECICSGTPVISYKSCGSPETVLDGCGYVVEENDVDAMLDRVRELRQNPLSKVGEIGLSSFDKNICYKAYLKEYEKLVK